MKRRKFTQMLAAAGAAITTGRTLAGPGSPDGESASPIQMKSVENIPVVLECAINGSTTKAKNPAVPETTKEMTAEIINCLDAGATIVHAHSNKPNRDIKRVAQEYIDMFGPVWKKHPHGIVYATANFDPQEYNRTRSVWPSKIQSGHHRLIAEAGAQNMVLFDTGVAPYAFYDKEGMPGPESEFFWYGFWPDDLKEIRRTCEQLGTGASISVFEPGWMKNVVAMAKAGTLPRGSKLNIYFLPYFFAAGAPPIPAALEMYLQMMEGLELKWSVGVVGQNIMDTPLARMALERGGSFRVGLEDWSNAPSNLEQLARAKELINAVGRPIVSGADAIRYLDIPYPATRP